MRYIAVLMIGFVIGMIFPFYDYRFWITTGIVAVAVIVIEFRKEIMR